MKKNKEFEAWFCEEQVENTLFPLLGKLYKEHKSILQSVWEASAKVQQAKIDRLQQEVERLTKCLVSANKEFEEFERKYYLEVNKVEDLTEQIERLRQPVSDFQLVSLLRVLTNCELPMEETRLRINSILERK